MNGEVDMIEQVTPDFLPVLESNPDIKLDTSVASQGMVVLNALHPPFNDARARQALYYLVNQKQMLAAMGYPTSTASTTAPRCTSAVRPWPPTPAPRPTPNRIRRAPGSCCRKPARARRWCCCTPPTT